MIKLIKVMILLFIPLIVSCLQPGITEKKVGAITATIQFDVTLLTGTDVITVSIINVSDNKVLVSRDFKDLKTTFDFTINDIPLPYDKDELNIIVRVWGDCCKEDFKSKIIKNQTTKLELIKFRYDPVDNPAAYVIFGKVLDENGKPIEGALVSNITGGELHQEHKPGDSTPNTSDSTKKTSVIDGNFSFYSYIYPITLEISANGKIMTVTIPKESQEFIVYKLVANARTLTGQVFDAKDKTKVLPDIKVKVLNQNIASKTDNNGEFSLRGVPLNEVTIIVNDSVNVTVPKTDNSSEVRLKPVLIND